VTGFDFSLLDVPREQPIEDPVAYLRSAIAWHFGESTDSAFWLRVGTAALRPAVHLLAAPDPARLNTELAFPCVWVAPWSRDDDLEPLRRSLVGQCHHR